MKLEFIIDQAYDTLMFWKMFRGGDPAGLESRAKSVGVDLALAKRINQEESEEVQEEVDQLVEDEYEKVGKFIERTRQFYQDSWDEITPEFFNTVEKLTEHPWFHEKFECVVSAFHPGISSWGGNRIARWWKENPYTQRRITAHELILSHYFSIIRQDFAEAELQDRQIWGLAEIAAWALTGLEDKLKVFWPWDRRGYYTDHNYPQLVGLQMNLKEPFIHRKSFKEYIEKGIELAKR